MNEYSINDVFEDLEEIQGVGQHTRVRNLPAARPPVRSRRKSQPQAAPEHDFAELAAEEDISGIKFTYQASRIEAVWLIDALGFFYTNHWIDDVLRRVKGGKEASVYLCSANPATGLSYLAAKVYRPRRLRNLRNDHLYREGRELLDADGNPIIDDKELHAIEKRTAYGLELSHTSWIEHEVRALKRLSEIGVRVPAPRASGPNAILMDFIGSPDFPAPTLNSVKLEPDEAEDIFHSLLGYVEIALGEDLIHGDLSAYNILYWEGDVTMIDLPQAVSPQQNRNAYAIFRRDIRRLCEYFIRQGVKADPDRIAAELWANRGLRRTPEIHPILLDDQDEGDRAYWNEMQDRQSY